MSGSQAPRCALRVPLAEHESARGLLLRIASRFGLQTSPTRARCSVEKLAEAVGVDPAALADGTATFSRDDQRAMLRGHAILLLDYEVAARRWCPLCFRDDRERGDLAPYHRFWWDLRFVGACPNHRVLMRDECHRCERRISWTHPSVWRCACGADLSRAPVTAVSNAAMGMTRLVIARLMQSGDDDPNARGLPLDRLPMFARRFGAALNCGWAWSRPVRAGVQREEDMSAAIAALAAPELWFSEALDRIAVGRENRAQGVHGAYGWLYRGWLANPEEECLQGRLIATMREHGVRHDIIADCEEMLGGKGGMSITQLAKRHRTSHERIVSILNAENLVLPSMRRGSRRALSPEQVAVVSKRLTGRLNGVEAALILGTTTGTLDILQRNGVLSRGADGKFDVTKVRRLPKRLARDDGAGQELAVLSARWRGRTYSTGEICAKILSGQVRAAALVPRPSRLSHVGLYVDDLHLCRRPRVGWPDLARQLGLHYQSARDLVALGVLPAKPVESGFAARIEAFKRLYVSATELARRSGLKSVRLLLQTEGVPIAYGRPVCRQIIYRCDDVARSSLARFAREDRPSTQP